TERSSPSGSDGLEQPPFRGSPLRLIGVDERPWKTLRISRQASSSRSSRRRSAASWFGATGSFVGSASAGSWRACWRSRRPTWPSSASSCRRGARRSSPPRSRSSSLLRLGPRAREDVDDVLVGRAVVGPELLREQLLELAALGQLLGDV